MRLVATGQCPAGRVQYEVPVGLTFMMAGEQDGN